MSTQHWRISPEGQKLGRSSARLAQLGQARLKALGLDNLDLPKLRNEMCQSCACRIGTVPNGCIHTQLDLLKTAAEGKAFLCHAPLDGRMCAGWVAMRAELAENPPPEKILSLLAKHEILPLGSHQRFPVFLPVRAAAIVGKRCASVVAKPN